MSKCLFTIAMLAAAPAVYGQEAQPATQQPDIAAPPLSLDAPPPPVVPTVPSSERQVPLVPEQTISSTNGTDNLTATSPATDAVGATEASQAASGDQASADNKENVIFVTGRRGPPPGDPLVSVNAASFVAVQAVDDAIIAPVTRGYKTGIPKPIRSGIHNFLDNLDEPIVFVNFLLQLKPGKAAETLGRFLINSTLGVAGLIDVSKRKPFNLPRRSNGLADTMGYYGIGPGPYLFLPLIGSTTLRDMFGRVVDLALVPTVVGKPFNDPTFALAKGSLSSLDERAEMDDDLKKIKASSNPYKAMREYYLNRRKREIDVLKGKVPLDEDGVPQEAAINERQADGTERLTKEVGTQPSQPVPHVAQGVHALDSTAERDGQRQSEQSQMTVSAVSPAIEAEPPVQQAPARPDEPMPVK